MTERDALHTAVLADPDSDLPRLVFADWCDDHGEADRAEFIRVQVALVRLDPGDPTRGPLEGRADALLHDGHHRWKVPGIRGVQGFVRGFVGAWDGTADWLLTAAGRLFESAPVREVRIRNADTAVPALRRLRELARVRTLDLSGNTLAAHSRLKRLLTEAPLGQLRSLKVGNNRLFADALPQIALSPVAPQLDELDLSGNPLADEGMAVLAGLEQLGGLTALVVRNNEQTFEDSIQSGGAKAFAATTAYPRLTRLDLTGHHIGDDGLRALIDSPLAGRLDQLRLGQNHIGRSDDEWASHLTRPGRGTVPRLIDLSGRKTTIRPRAATVLAGWSKLAEGVTFDLRGCRLSGNGRAYAILAASPHRGTRLLIDDHPQEESE